ncbi:MAG: metallophosphoesterase family protein [Pirellulaceae bacterium]
MSLLILSDIHGNWPALEAVIAAEPEVDIVAFCGDVVDYGPQPVECVRWLMDHANHFVRGNHDNALAFDVDCQCLGTFREFSLATRSWHRTLLGKLEQEFLQAMPMTCRFQCDEKCFLMSHATPHGDMFEYLDMNKWSERVSNLNADFVLLGHTHLQGMRVCDDVTVVNPGSVGLARDYPGQACYAVYTGGHMQLKRIQYDVDRTLAMLRKSPLPQQIVQGLAAVLGETTV